MDQAQALASAGTAFQVQAQVAALLGEHVAGWKVGLHEDGSGWGAPVFAGDTLRDGDTFHFSGDLKSVKIEAELAIRLGHDLPHRPGQPYDRAELLAACSEIFTGIELVGTRFADPQNLGFFTRLADNFANTAYAVSAGTKDFAALDLPNLRCTLSRDGTIVSDCKGGHQAGDPLIPALAFVNTQGDHLGGLKAGQFITTGTLTEPFDLSGNASLTATLEHLGTVRLLMKNE